MKQSFEDWIRDLDPGTLADYVSDYVLSQNEEFLKFHDSFTVKRGALVDVSSVFFFYGLYLWLNEVYDSEDE